MGVILDIGPVNVRGQLRGQFARVIWANDTLYVVTMNGGAPKVQSIASQKPVEPDDPKGYWRAEVEGGTVRFTRKGCSTCGGRYPRLRSIKLEDIFNGLS